MQAGFPEHEASQSTTVNISRPESSTTVLKENKTGREPTQESDAAAAPPPKKKRKRTPKSKRDGYAAQRAAEAGITLEGKPNDGGGGEVDETKTGGDSEQSTLTRVEKKQKRNLARRMKGPFSSRFFMTRAVE